MKTISPSSRQLAPELTSHRSGLVQFHFHICLGIREFGGPQNLRTKLPHWEFEARFAAFPAPLQFPR